MSKLKLVATHHAVLHASHENATSRLSRLRARADMQLTGNNEKVLHTTTRPRRCPRGGLSAGRICSAQIAGSTPYILRRELDSYSIKATIYLKQYMCPPSAMAMHEMDVEKGPLATMTEMSPSTSEATKPNSLYVYQTLVGDISSPNLAKDGSLYDDIVHREHKARYWVLLTALGFGILVATQIVLCLGIAIGAQTGLGKDTISILAGVNTGVAAGIAVLKGLGLPEKKIVEKHKLEKLAEKIRFTTRRIKAGLDVDAAKEADDALKAHEEVEDEALVLPNVGDASAPVPKPTEEKK
jgi:hypothetical protein